MTEIKSILNLIVADQSSKLSDFAIGHQQIIFLQDKRVLALDYNGKRTFYNQIEIWTTDKEREEFENPSQGTFHFVIGTASLWFYDSDWIRITEPPKEILFIGDKLPEYGSENILYVDKEDREISVWDEEIKQYIIVANYTEEASNFGKKIFEVIHRTKDQFALDKDYKINCEQIPGEQAAAKMQKADEFLYPDTVVKDLPLYGNQFIPLGIKTTIQERIRIASQFDSYCNGGSIAHINIEAPFDSFEKAWDLTNYIADQGLTYFAFNTKIQACKHNHAFFGTKCPICGEPVATEYTRIVGFYTPIKTWSAPRKAEYKMREWENVNG